MPGQFDPRAMDMMAQRRGFKDAATMQAFYARQREGQGARGNAMGPELLPDGVNLRDATFFTPSAILGWVRDRLDQVMPK